VAHILIVEDNADLAGSLAHNLRLEGYEVRIADEGRSGIALAHDWPADLVILDLMLPGIDGFEVLQVLRGNGSRVPVIILSARGEESDKVRGFRLDADQYVTKPFGVLEIIERVAALLRRAAGANGDSIIRFGTIVVDPTTHTATRAGQPCALTPKAFALLLALVRRKGAVVSRAELLREVWGYGSFVLTRTVDSHIAELRRKLEDDPADPQHIVTVWTVGYRFVP
jgi:two-component system, OmpR family, alkaline phosphatase synthesis response regulator PhoP